MSNFTAEYVRRLEDVDHRYELENALNWLPPRSVMIFIYDSNGRLITSNAPPPEKENLSDLQTASTGGEVFNTVEYEGVTYLAFIPAELSLEEDAEVVIMQIVEENGEELLEAVEDDEIADAVFDIVMERAEAEEDE